MVEMFKRLFSLLKAQQHVNRQEREREVVYPDVQEVQVEGE